MLVLYFFCGIVVVVLIMSVGFSSVGSLTVMCVAAVSSGVYMVVLVRSGVGGSRFSVVVVTGIVCMLVVGMLTGLV